MFVGVWTDLSWLVILLMSLSLIFAVAECLIPGFGICGIMSIVCSTAGLVIEGMCVQDVIAILLLLACKIIVEFLVLGICILSLKRGVLSRSPLIEKKTSINENYGENDSKKKLLGKAGEVVSSCKPVGKVNFDGEIYTVVSSEGYIEKGSMVFVTEVRDNLVFVKDFNGGENNE